MEKKTSRLLQTGKHELIVCSLRLTADGVVRLEETLDDLKKLIMSHVPVVVVVVVVVCGAAAAIRSLCLRCSC